MAWSTATTVGGNGSKTSGDTLSHNPTASIPADAIVFVTVYSDNVATTSGESNTVISVTDSQNNQYSKAFEYTNSSGASGDGATVALFIGKATTGLATTDSITVTWSQPLGARQMHVHYRTVDPGKSFAVVGTAGATGSSATPSVTLSGQPTNIQLVWHGAVSLEGTGTTSNWTQDADYTEGRTQRVTQGGASDSNNCAVVAGRRATIASDTFNPVSAISGDWAALLVTVKETTPGVTHNIDAILKKKMSASASIDASLSSSGGGGGGGPTYSLTIIDGFDHQVASTSGYGSGENKLWNAIANAAGITFDTTIKRTGVASLKMVQDGVNATSIAKGIPAGNRVIVFSLYFRVASAPTANSRMIVVNGPTNIPQFRIHTDGTIRASADGSATAVTGPNVADGNWHRLDARVNVSTSTFTIDWQVDGVSQTQASASGQTAADITFLRIGSGVASDTLTAWFDDMVASFTSSDYPIGAHYVRFLTPNADGTHNNAANVMERASDGADIDGSTVTAWNLLDEWPPTTGTNSADTVTQATAGGSNYVEVQFSDVTDSTVLGVEAIVALQSDGTTANNGTTKIRDANGTETTVYSGDMSDTSPRYQRAIVTTPTGGWSQSAVNSLRARIGFSTIASPQPEWLSLALQAAVTGVLSVSHGIDAKIGGPTSVSASIDTIITGGVNPILVSSGVDTTDAITYTIGPVNVNDNPLVLFVNITGSNKIVQSVDGLNLTWSKAGSIKWDTSTSPTRELSVWVGSGTPQSGTITITANNTATSCGWALIELENADRDNPIAQLGTAISDTAVTTLNVPTPALSNLGTGSVVLTMLCKNGTATPTQESGHTLLTSAYSDQPGWSFGVDSSRDTQAAWYWSAAVVCAGIAIEVPQATTPPPAPTPTGKYAFTSSLIWGAGFQNVGCVVSGSTVLTGGDVAGVHRSDDYGSTWLASNYGVTSIAHRNTASLYASPNISGRVWRVASTQAVGGGGTMYIIRSNDSGKTWSVLVAKSGWGVESGGDAHPRQSGKLILERIGDSNRLVLGTNDGIKRSTDAGNTWSNLALTGTRITGIAQDPLNNERVWVTSDGGTNPGVYMIDNAFTGTATVTQVSSALIDAQECVAIAIGSSVTLYVAAGSSGIWAYDGTTWTDKTGSLNTATSRWAAIDGYYTGSAVRLIAGCVNPVQGSQTGWYTCIVRSTNGGNTWTDITQSANIDNNVNGDASIGKWWFLNYKPSLGLGKSGYDTGQLVIHPTNRNIAWSFGRSGVWRTQTLWNTTPTWHPVVRGLGVTIEWTAGAHPDDVKRAAIGDTDWQILVTEDDWKTVVQNNPSGNKNGHTIFIEESGPGRGRLWLGVGNRDTNTEGEIWSAPDWWTSPSTWRNENWPIVNRVFGVIALRNASNQEVVIAYGDDAGLYRKVNQGAWQQVLAVPGSPENKVITFASSNQYVWCYIPHDGLYRSSDYGATWSKIWSLLTSGKSVGYICLDPDVSTTLWLSVANALYKITNAHDGSIDASTGTITATKVSVTGLTKPGPIAARKGWGIYVANLASGGTALFRSTDGGSTWTDIADDNYRGYALFPKDIFIDTAGGVLVATDGNATIRGYPSKALSHNIDTVIAQAKTTRDHSLDTLIKRRGISAYVNVDAIQKKKITTTASLDSLLSRRSTSTATVNSLLRKTLRATAALDARMSLRTTSSYAADAILSKRYNVTQSLDAIIRPPSKTHSIDSYIVKPIRYKKSRMNAAPTAYSDGYGVLSAALSISPPFTITASMKPEGVGKQRPFHISTAESLPSISGLVAHYDAASIPTDTTTVGTWQDSSGNGRHATQTTESYKPIYMRRGFFGHPCVYFDGQDDRLNLPNLGITGDQETVFIVASLEGPNRNNLTPTAWTFVETGSGQYVRIGVWKSSTTGLYNIQAAVQKTTYKSVDSAYTYVTDAGHIISAVANGTSLKMWIDEIFIGENTNVDSGNLGTSGGLIGGRDSGSSNGFANVKVAEVIIYNRALTDTERSSVESYLSRKYGFADPFGTSSALSLRDIVIPTKDLSIYTMIYGTRRTTVYRNGRTISNFRNGNQAAMTHIHLLGSPAERYTGSVSDILISNKELTHGQVIGIERLIWNRRRRITRVRHSIRSLLKARLKLKHHIDALIQPHTVSHKIDVTVITPTYISHGIDVSLSKSTISHSIDVLIPNKNFIATGVDAYLQTRYSLNTGITVITKKTMRSSHNLDTSVAASIKIEPDGLYHRNWTGQTGPYRAVVIRFTWESTEPSQGSYDWTAVDNAIASSPVPVRLRPSCGKDAPTWVKSAVGTFTYIEPQSGDVVDMPNIWSPTYQQYVANWYAAMAQHFDDNPKVVTVFAAGGMTYYAEPFIRGTSDATNRQNMLAIGYTQDKDKALLRDQLSWMSSWKRTRIGLAYNPWQYITSSGGSGSDTVFMEEVMNLQVSMYGARAILQNNSLRSSWITNNSWPSGYQRMYDLLWMFAAAGYRVDLQLAAASRVGDEELCIRYAADHGVSGVEVSNTLTNAQYTSLQNELWPQ